MEASGLLDNAVRSTLLLVAVGLFVLWTRRRARNQSKLSERPTHIRVDSELIAQGSSFDVIAPVFWMADIYSSLANYEASLARFAQAQRLFLAIHWYSSEVSNGGHHQFFWNSTGIVWKDALAGFDLLGQGELASILREAAARFGQQPSFDINERQTALETLDLNFDDLDERFFELQESGELERAVMSYIRKHPGEFLFDDDIPALEEKDQET